MRGPTAPAPARDLPSPFGAHPLDALITPERCRRFRQVLARRTGRLAVVVEDCHDPHNATAVVRTCDAFGIHRVVVITGRNSFKVNPKISQGCHRYVAIEHYDAVAPAVASLRARGFRLLVSDLAAEAAVGPQRLAPMLDEAPLALVFGSESTGVSPELSAAAHGYFLIPMAGFSQSLNLSVSVATSLYALRGAALAEDRPGDLSADEQRACYEAWIRADRGAAAELVMRQATGRQGEALEVLGPE